MNRFGRFRGKLMLLIVVAQFGVASMLVWSSANQIQTSFDSRLERQGTALQRSLLDAFARGDHAHLPMAIDAGATLGMFSHVSLYDELGQLVVSRGSDDLAKPNPRTHAIRSFRLEQDGRFYGSLEIATPLRPVQEATLALIKQAVPIVAIGVAGTLLLLWLLTHSLTHSLYALYRTTRAWAQGDLSARAPVARADAIGGLAREFNRIADILAERVKALQEAREEFRAIADYTLSWESWIDQSGRLRWVNPSVERVAGYTTAECFHTEDYPWVLIHPEDRLRAAAIRERFLRGQAGGGEEVRIVRKDGQTRWVRMDWQPIFGDSGKRLGIRLSMVDISRRRHVEEALRASEARFAEAERVANLGHWEWNLDTGEVYWSAETYRIYGLSLDGAAHSIEASLARVADEDRERVKAAIEETLATGEPYVVEHRIVTADGSVRYVQSQGRLLKNAHGQPARMFGTMQDITTRKTAELELARITRLYAVLNEANKAIVRARDRSALFHAVCRIIVEIGGLELAWVGAPSADGAEILPLVAEGAAAGYCNGLRVPLLAAGEQAGPIAQVFQTWRSGIYQQLDDLDMQEPPPDGCRAYDWGLKSCAVLPLIEGDSAVAVLCVYSREPGYFSGDIVELMESLAGDVSFALQAQGEERRRREAEAELLRLNDSLEQQVAERTAALEGANRELEAFTYSVSHDLRAPLRRIDGFSKLLLDQHGARLNSEAKDYLERIVRASERMGQLIDDLLRLAYIGRQPLHTSTVDLSSLAQSVIEDLRSSGRDRAVAVEIEPQLIAVGDAKLLRIVLENLLANAWKFTAYNPAARVRFGGYREGRESVFFVADNGAGFDTRYANKLFAPFQRLHTADEFEGNGIGLATVRRIINMHGGRVWADAKVGMGATFFFALKAVEASSEHHMKAEGPALVQE